MKFFILVTLALFSMTGCSVKSDLAAPTGNADQSVPDQKGNPDLELNAPKSTGAATAHFVYCHSSEIEAAIDFKTSVLGTQADIFNSQIGARAVAGGAFALYTVNSISSSSFNGTNYFGVVSNQTDGAYVYDIETQDYQSAMLKYSDWNQTFTKQAPCLIYQSNPFNGTAAWPVQHP